MRIPLDYYRILGLPIQATAEQLQQAYRDRALQLPRHEYSEVAIDARKQLLDEAYAVLSDPEQRSSYDASFLNNVETQDVTSVKSSDQEIEPGTASTASSADADQEPYIPSLEIQNEQFVGALLIIHELGEYELVLKLSRPYLSSGSLSISLDKGRLGNPQLIRPDIVLTTALACLELGREQWQQGQYENAASSLETGLKLLLSEGLFPSLRGEIQADLYRLRPYRILELLALSEENFAERQQGLQLLQDMLQERGGIDGTGNDQSGLSIDDFLRFIQQLRGYLTSAEQQALFEAEAKRPSAVATYLAVYALLGRGFSQRQPAAIARAKQMLMRLGKRQDVHLEQSVCALLLGQTEEASRALELSQEYEPLAFIREHSQGSPDLLPGLCLYGERWLQTEVFPHFRDLAKEGVSLKDYFADEQVQTYLENMPTAADTASDWAVEPQQVDEALTTATLQVPSDRSTPSSSNSHRASEAIEHQQGDLSWQDTELPDYAVQQPGVVRSQQAVEHEPVPANTSASVTATLAPTVSTSPVSGVSSPSTSEGILSTPQVTELNTTSLPRESSPSRRRRQTKSRKQTSGSLFTHLRRTKSLPQALPSADDIPPLLLPSRVKRTPAKSKSYGKTGPVILLALACLVGGGVVGLLALGTYKVLHKNVQSSSALGLKGEQPLVQLDRPPLPIPVPESEAIATDSSITKETAQEVVETWLDSKAQALGKDHKVEPLEEILAPPALSRWQKRAEVAKNNNSYWQYKHSVEVESVKTVKDRPERATVEAAVNEVAQLYQGDKLKNSSSYNDNLRVRYDLVRQDTKWRIRDMTVLK